MHSEDSTLEAPEQSFMEAVDKAAKVIWTRWLKNGVVSSSYAHAAARKYGEDAEKFREATLLARDLCDVFVPRDEPTCQRHSVSLISLEGIREILVVGRNAIHQNCLETDLNTDDHQHCTLDHCLTGLCDECLDACRWMNEQIEQVDFFMSALTSGVEFAEVIEQWNAKVDLYNREVEYGAKIAEYVDSEAPAFTDLAARLAERYPEATIEPAPEGGVLIKIETNIP